MNIELYKLYASTNPDKKFDVFVVNPDTGRTKKVSFGAKGYEDYTIHKDKERRTKYRQRHSRDNIHDPTSPGFWSWWVLWGESTSLDKNMKAARRIISNM